MALRAAYMALHRSTEAALDEHGVSADQFVLLLALSEGQALTQRELAGRISSDPSTVRAMLVLLERAGLVERCTHPTDSRAKSVSLTTAGKRKIRSLWRSGQPIRDDMYACMTSNEATTLITLLRRIANSLQIDHAVV